MLKYFLFLIFLNLIDGAQVRQCSKLHSQQNTTVNGKDVKFTFEFDVDISKTATKQYFNNLKFFNYSHVSSNDPEYNIKQFWPLQYWDGNEGVMIKCQDITLDCTIQIPDGIGFLELPLSINGVNEFPSLIDLLVIDSGITFFSSGVFFNPDTRNCFEMEEFGMILMSN